VGYCWYFQKTAQSKQSLIGRKFTQPGHPALRRSSDFFLKIWIICWAGSRKKLNRERGLWPFKATEQTVTWLPGRVARWFVFKPKIPNLGKFCGALDWKMFIYVMAIWNILWRFGIFYDHLVHFVFIWYILYSFGTFCIHLVHFVFIWYILYLFGTFFRVLVSCTKKNLATLLPGQNCCIACRVGPTHRIAIDNRPKLAVHT
jgi:hypothetical protein